jgi:hypothetical protein
VKRVGQAKNGPCLIAPTARSCGSQFGGRNGATHDWGERNTVRRMDLRSSQRWMAPFLAPSTLPDRLLAMSSTARPIISNAGAVRKGLF